MATQDVLSILSAMSKNVGTEQDKLQQLAAEPIKRNFIEPGQSGMQMLANPNEHQRSALLQAGLSMLGSDPRDPSAGMSKGIASGINLHNTMREDEHVRKLAAQKVAVEGAESGFERAMDVSALIPEADKVSSQRQDVEYLGPDGGAVRTGFASFNPSTQSWVDESGSPLSAGQFRPIVTGRTSEDMVAAGKAPTGYRFKEDGTLEPIPGGPKDQLAVGDAAKAAMVEGGLKSLDEIDTILFGKNEDGTIDRNTVNRGDIFASNIPLVGGSIPFTEGRSMDVLYRDAIEGKIRLESGAAVPEIEVDRANIRFRPNVFDSDNTIRLKRRLLERYFNDAKSFYDPHGTLGADGKPTATLNAKGESFFAEIDAELEAEAASEGPRPPSGIDPQLWNTYSVEQQRTIRQRMGGAQ